MAPEMILPRTAVGGRPRGRRRAVGPSVPESSACPKTTSRGRLRPGGGGRRPPAPPPAPGVQRADRLRAAAQQLYERFVVAEEAIRRPVQLVGQHLQQHLACLEG